MEKLDIQVCVCTECVMDGAIDIIESIERLVEMKSEMEEEYYTDMEIIITPVKCLGEAKHGAHSPKVSINGLVFENTDSQTIMAEIISIMKKDVIV